MFQSSFGADNGTSYVNSYAKYIYHEETTQSFTEEENKKSTDFLIDFEHSVSGAGSIKSNTRSKRRKRQSVSEGGDDTEVNKVAIKEIEQIRTVQKAKVKWATLYIQMELCQSTLKQWLQTRNNFEDAEKAIVAVNENSIRLEAVNKILVQLLKGDVSLFLFAIF